MPTHTNTLTRQEKTTRSVLELLERVSTDKPIVQKEEEDAVVQIAVLIEPRMAKFLNAD
jgi:hypothetical protein